MHTYSHTHHDTSPTGYPGSGYDPSANDDPSGSYPPPAPGTLPKRNWTLMIGIAVLTLLAGIGAGGLVAGGRNVAADSRAAAAFGDLGAGPTTVVGTDAEPAGAAAPGPDSSGPAAPASPRSAGASPSSGGNAAPPAPSAGPAPTITSFQTPDGIDCHNGNFQTFTARWTTTNAVKTTISIDGPGVYDTYGPSAEVSLPFNCSSPHTFLLTAYGEGGATATRSITLHPRNVEAQGQSDPEEL